MPCDIIECLRHSIYHHKTDIKGQNISNVQYQPSIEQAIKSINLKSGDLLLITGSLYGAAEVLNLN